MVQSGLRDRPRLLVGAGVALLLAGLAFFYLGAPAYTTEIETKAPDRAAMSDQLEEYSVGEIDPILSADLSSAEKTAFQRARQSPQGRYSDRGASDDGSAFTYRNDVVNRYFVTYDRELYLLTVVTEIDPIAVVAGAGSGITGLVVIGIGYQSS